MTLWFGAWEYLEDDRSKKGDSKKSIKDVHENKTESDIVQRSERNEQIVDNWDEMINNVAANVETLDEET